MGLLGPLASLVGGVLLAGLAALGLRQGLFSALGAWPRVAATAAPLALAAPTFAFCAYAARQGLAGAALGAAAGGFAGIGLAAGVVAWSGARETARRATTLSACALLAGAAVVITAFDGKVTMPEGRLMLLAALAILLVAWRARAETPALGSGPSRSPQVVGAGLAVVAAALVALGAWLAAGQIASLAGQRADGDLELGLTALGFGAALPSIVVAWRAARGGQGGAAFVEVATTAAVGLAGGVGAAALIVPLSISESFLDWPLLGLCAAALTFLVLASLRPRSIRWLRVAGGVAYAGLLAAFARCAG